MDWKQNKIVGLAAALLIVAGVAAAVLYLRPAKGPDYGGYTFECSSTGQTFKITDDEAAEPAANAKYFANPGQPVECKLDGKVDAYWVYYCPVEKKYYRYTPELLKKDTLVCPNGHEVQ